MQIEMPQTSYEDILQRLVRRYLFKLERMKEEGEPILFCRIASFKRIDLRLNIQRFTPVGVSLFNLHP